MTQSSSCLVLLEVLFMQSGLDLIYSYKMWMLLREDCTNLIQCSGVFNMGICAFAPHLSKSLDQFCSLRSEQSPMQFILNWTSLHEIFFRLLYLFLTVAH